MKIKIFERSTPFSHKPGTACLIPGTMEIVRAFPSKINDERLDVEGPVKEWTISQDLERAKVAIRGIAKNGYFTREILGCSVEQRAKLTFGIHKAQQMDRIKERAAPEEFLPFWFALGQYYLGENTLEQYGSLGDTLLNDVYCVDRQHLYLAWKHLFQAGFSDWMIPRSKDEEFLGFAKDPVMGENPHILLPVGALLIRQMLLHYDDVSLKVLPKLPPELHCGRLLDQKIPGIGTVSLEWSKKEIKKIILHPSCTRELLIEHPKRIQSYRVRTKCCTSRQTIEKTLKIEKDRVIYFDQFQH